MAFFSEINFDKFSFISFSLDISVPKQIISLSLGLLTIIKQQIY